MFHADVEDDHMRHSSTQSIRTEIKKMHVMTLNEHLKILWPL